MPATHPRSTIRGETFLLLALLCITLAYIIARAVHVPFVQDEANSVWYYLRPGEFLPFRSRPDAGNHFMSTMLGLAGFELFGYTELAIRWGSIIAFLIYAWGCWVMARPFPLLLRWCALLALAWCPFLLDFFSLFRGYGISMAGWIWALYALTRIASANTTRNWWLLVAAAGCALFANLSLIPDIAIVLALALALQFGNRKMPRSALVETAFPALLLGAVLLFTTIIAFDLRSRNLLYLGSGNGTMATVQSLYRSIFSRSASNAMLALLAAPVCLAFILVTRRILVGLSLKTPLVVLTGVLFADMAARTAMFHLLGTNFPEGRAALHWLPLYLLIIAHLCNVLYAWRPWGHAASLFLLAGPFWTLQDLNTNRLISEYELAIPKRFVREAHSLQDSLGRPLLVSGHFRSEWALLQASMGIPPIEMREDIDPDDPDDARILAGSTLKQYGLGYHTWGTSPSGNVLLLLPDQPAKWNLVADTTLPVISGKEEFTALPMPHTVEAGSTGLLLEFNARLTAADRDADLQLVTALEDLAGNSTRYDGVRFEHWTELSAGADVAVARFLPRRGPGQRWNVYLWNARRSEFRMDHIRIHLSMRLPSLPASPAFPRKEE
ncbi:MAG: hypothetical protein JST38_04640 [Bacteroidetes bacterium]|nr:hypothetical protein [Bacteroidota bacterium]